MGEINRYNGHCMACLNDDQQVRYIDLYVIGSEGLTICHSCEMKLVRKVQELRREAGLARKQAFLDAHPLIKARVDAKRWKEANS